MMQPHSSAADQGCLRAVELLLPRLRACDDGGEAREELSPRQIELLRSSELTSVFRPGCMGGRDVDLSDYLRAVAALARADASVAWCLQIYNVTNWLVAGLFDDSVLQTMYADGSGGLVTGSMVPNGPCQATPSGAGYHLTGKWRFVSGCDHADWIFLKAPLPGEGLPRRHLLALAPQDHCELADDWQYSGLQATGSKGVAVESLDVPGGFAVPFDDHLLEQGVPEARGRTLPVYRIPSRVIMRLPITAVALGVARRALDLFEENINQTRPNGFAPRSKPSFQRRYAESALDIAQAEYLLHATASQAEARARGGEAFPQLVRASCARDLVQAVHLCAQAVDRLMAVSGARQMFTASPMQGAFRDIHAIACHHSCDRDRVMSIYAKVRLGLDLEGEEV